MSQELQRIVVFGSTVSAEDRAKVMELLPRAEAPGSTWQITNPGERPARPVTKRDVVLYIGDITRLAPSMVQYWAAPARRLAWLWGGGSHLLRMWASQLGGCHGIAVATEEAADTLRRLAPQMEVTLLQPDADLSNSTTDSVLGTRLEEWIAHPVPSERAVSPPVPLPLADVVTVKRTVGLGDVIFALSVAEQIAQAAHDAQLHFVTDARFLGFVSWFPFVDSASSAVSPSPPPGLHPRYFDLQNIPTADGENRIGIMARAAGITTTKLVTTPQIPSEMQERVRTLLRNTGVRRGERLIAVAPFSSGRALSRSLSTAETHALLERIGQMKRNSRALHREALTGEIKKGLRTRRLLLHNEPVSADAAPRGTVNLSGRLNVEEAVALLAVCDRFVGVDSGLLYAALMLRVPSVALYSHIAPLSRIQCAEGYVALQPVGRDCFPCGDFAGNPRCTGLPWQHECMRMVADPDVVTRALADVQSDSRLVRDVASDSVTVRTDRAAVRDALPQHPGGRRLTTVRAQRRRLLFVAPWLTAGGGERHLLLLCQGLTRFADIEIVVTDAGHPTHFAVEFGSWPVTNLAGDWQDKALNLAGLIDARKPDVIGFYNNPLALDALGRCRHRPRRVFAIIHTVFDSEMHMLTHGESGIVDAFVCVSENVRRMVAERLTADRPLVVIRNGVRTADFDEGGTVRVELGYGSEDFVIGSIGRIAAGKNADLTIRAIALLPDHVKGLLIGLGEDVENCQRLMWDLKLGERIKILGPTTDVAPRFRSLNAYVLPSDVEGAVPYALMEAMAARVPALVTRVSDVPLLFRDGQ